MSNRNGRAEEVRQVEFRASEDADGQTLEGYAAVFNEWTNIRDALGEYRERIAPGAFKRSLGQRTPVLQFDHGTHPLIGSLPLGSITALREDRNGLFVKARLSDNWLVQPVRDAISEKAISGMSFRFRVVSDDWEQTDDGETRTINEVELLELGPVVFPAYEQTSVAVRSLVRVLDDEMRDALRTELFGSPPIRIDVGTSKAVGGIIRSDSLTVIGDGPTMVGDGSRELFIPHTSTSDVASEPAVSDSPDEPPVASHEVNRNRIADALARFRHAPTKETSDAHQ